MAQPSERELFDADNAFIEDAAVDARFDEDEASGEVWDDLFEEDSGQSDPEVHYKQARGDDVIAPESGPESPPVFGAVDDDEADAPQRFIIDTDTDSSTDESPAEDSTATETSPAASPWRPEVPALAAATAASSAGTTSPAAPTSPASGADEATAPLTAPGWAPSDSAWTPPSPEELIAEASQPTVAFTPPSPPPAPPLPGSPAAPPTALWDPYQPGEPLGRPLASTTEDVVVMTPHRRSGGLAVPLAALAALLAALSLMVSLGLIGDAPGDSVGTEQVRDNTLLAEDFNSASLPRGAQGREGQSGPPGALGPQGEDGDRGKRGKRGSRGELPELRTVSKTSSGRGVTKSVTASCPGGQRAVSGGARVSGDDRAAIVDSEPKGKASWEASATALNRDDTSFQITATVKCVSAE